MSLATKPFLYLMFVLVVMLPFATFAHAQTEVDQHEANVWQAKVEFWRGREARQQLVDEHTVRTWESKTAFWRGWEAHQQLVDEHTVRTWESKTAFWRGWEARQQLVAGGMTP